MRGSAVRPLFSEPGALDAYGRIDVLFNNAGIAGAQTPLVDFPQDVFERVLQVNLMGTLLGMKHVLPTMIAQGSGAIASGRRQPRRCADNTAAFS